MWFLLKLGFRLMIPKLFLCIFFFFQINAAISWESRRVWGKQCQWWHVKLNSSCAVLTWAHFGAKSKCCENKPLISLKKECPWMKLTDFFFVFFFIFESIGLHQGPRVSSLWRRKRFVQRRRLDQIHRDVHRSLEHHRVCRLWRYLYTSRFTGKALCKSSRRILKYCSGE